MSRNLLGITRDSHGTEASYSGPASGPIAIDLDYGTAALYIQESNGRQASIRISSDPSDPATQDAVERFSLTASGDHWKLAGPRNSGMFMSGGSTNIAMGNARVGVQMGNGSVQFNNFGDVISFGDNNIVSGRSTNVYRSSGVVRIDLWLPTDSDLQVDAGTGNITADLHLDRAKIDLGTGNIRVGGCADLRVDLGTGNVEVDDLRGKASLDIGTGNVAIHAATGAAATASVDLGTGNVVTYGNVRLHADVGIGRVTQR